MPLLERAMRAVIAVGVCCTGLALLGACSIVQVSHNTRNFRIAKMGSTHAVCVNGRTWYTIGVAGRSNADQIRETLARLDGTSFYALLLWELPPGRELGQTSPKRDAVEYSQCAGMAERMTIEVRRLSNRNAEQFVVGRTTSVSDPKMTETVRWDAFETMVAPSEVFNAAEAARVFDAYLRTGWVPESYNLRRMTLTPG